MQKITLKGVVGFFRAENGIWVKSRVNCQKTRLTGTKLFFATIINPVERLLRG